MKRLALFGVIAVLGTPVGYGGSPAISTASGALREILPPAQRAATTADPFQIGSNYYGWAFLNWSGYAVTATQYTAVTGSWTVPTVTPSGGATYSSAWTGIGGFDTNDLIQTGTEQDSFHGQTSYSAWWTTNEESYAPQNFTTLTCVSPCIVTPSTFTVNPDDHMTASIIETSLNQWTITLTDNTTGVGGTETNVSHTASGGASGGDSAEWIIERPAFVSPSGAAHLAKLADYGTTTFDPGTVNSSANPGFVANSTSSDAGIMVQGAVKVISIPSAPDIDIDGFSISYGSTAPSPPSS